MERADSLKRSGDQLAVAGNLVDGHANLSLARLIAISQPVHLIKDPAFVVLLAALLALLGRNIFKGNYPALVILNSFHNSRSNGSAAKMTLCHGCWSSVACSECDVLWNRR